MMASTLMGSRLLLPPRAVNPTTAPRSHAGSLGRVTARPPQRPFGVTVTAASRLGVPLSGSAAAAQRGVERRLATVTRLPSRSRTARAGTVRRRALAGADDSGDAAGMASPSTEAAGQLVDSKVIAMIVLIAGTTIGGGTLALPAAAAGPGFVPALSALAFCWLFLFAEAVLLVEVAVRMKKEGTTRAGEPVSFEQMAERTLGKVGGLFTGLVYQFYSYASILAYVSAVGNVVALLSQNMLTAVQGQIVTTFGIWAIILLAGKKGIENINEKANYVFFLLLATIITVGCTRINAPTLMVHASWSAAPAAAGILLFNVVFHDIIPLVVDALDYNIKKINFAFFIGGFIPVVCYMFWIACALGAGVGVAAGGAFVDPVNAVMMSGSLSGKVVQVWAFLAIATSFIGCGMAQAEYEASLLRQWMQPVWAKVTDASSGLGRAKKLWDEGGLDMASYGVTLLPPLAISLAFPDLFFKAADLAGVYGVAILYGVLPPLMAWVLRRQQAAKDSKSVALNSTPGGGLTLFLLFAAGMGIAIRETLTYLPFKLF